MPNDAECDEGNGSDLESTGGEDDTEEDMCEVDDVESVSTRQASHDEDVSPEGKAVLTRVTNFQRQQHLQGLYFTFRRNSFLINMQSIGNASGSITASDRLMKELREIYRSSNYKNG